MNKPINTDEQKLHKILARASHQGQQPFSVPQDYFKDLQPRIMAQIKHTEVAEDAKENQHEVTISSKQDRNLFTFLRHSIIRLSAAAMLAGVFALTGTMIYRQVHTTENTTAEPSLSLSAFSDTEEYGDELLDYAMLDNCDIEYYLTSAD